MKAQLRLLISGGLQMGKFCLGLEYNSIPKSKIEMPNGKVAGSVQDIYFKASIGCIFGRGTKKERKK